MENQTNPGCYGADSVTVYKVYAGLNMVMGLLAFVFGVFAVALLFILNKHLFYNHRLLMYLNISNIYGGIVSMASINPFLSDGVPTRSVYCTINGFFFNCFILTQLMIVWWIALNGFRLSIATKGFRQPSFLLETILLILSFIIPPLVLWIPALPQIDLYGPDGPLCDLQSVNYTTCHTIINGYIGLSVYTFIPYLATLITFPILLIVGAYKIHKETKMQDESYCPQQRELSTIRKEVRRIQVYPLVYFVFCFFSVVHFITVGIVRSTSESKTYGTVVLTTLFVYIVSNNARGVIHSCVYLFWKSPYFKREAHNINFIKTILKRKKIGKVVSYSNMSNLYVSYSDSLGAKELRNKLQEDNTLTDVLIDT